MTIANGSAIEADDLNEVFSDDAPALTLLGGLSRGLDAQKDKNNGYCFMRFRQEDFVLSTSGTPKRYRFRFTSPDDCEILTVGIIVRCVTAVNPTVGTRVVATLQGVVTDLENDLPVPDHLFLTEPVFNVDGENYVELRITSGALANVWASTRYVSYERNTNRPCNTLLKGATYELVVENLEFNNLTTPNLVEVVLGYKTKLRRN